MDGEQRQLNVKVISTLVVLQAFAYPAYATDAVPGPDFLEWLGMVSDTSEIGIDIGDLIEQYDNNAATTPDTTEQTGNEDSSISPGTEQ